MSGDARFWWWDEDGWKVAMMLEHIVKVRQIEGALPPAFEIKLPGRGTLQAGGVA